MLYAQVWPECGQRIQHLAGNEEENELFEKARTAPAGDMRAFEQLIARNRGRIVADCRHITKDESVSEDLAQEVFLKAYFGMKNFEGRSSFRHWLQVIKVNHCLNHLKKKRNKPEDSIDDEDAAPSSEQIKALSADDRTEDRLSEQQIIHRVLDAMPAKLRIPLVLRDMDELSYEEVATTLGIGLSAAKMQIKRAREWFREQYEAQCARAGREASA